MCVNITVKGYAILCGSIPPILLIKYLFAYWIKLNWLNTGTSLPGTIDTSFRWFRISVASKKLFYDIIDGFDTASSARVAIWQKMCQVSLQYPKDAVYRGIFWTKLSVQNTRLFQEVSSISGRNPTLQSHVATAFHTFVRGAEVSSPCRQPMAGKDFECHWCKSRDHWLTWQTDGGYLRLDFRLFFLRTLHPRGFI